MLMSAAASLRPKGCQACQSATPIFPFTMAFQPIVDIHERRIDGYEALVRSPTGGGASEVLAQVTPENVYAFDQACRVKAIELAARLGMDVTLSINFLPNAVYEPRACIRATLDAAARTGFRPDRLTFEIVETENIADTGHLLRIISEYRRQGFKIALDDFGTGYSGLARLAELRRTAPGWRSWRAWSAWASRSASRWWSRVWSGPARLKPCTALERDSSRASTLPSRHWRRWSETMPCSRKPRLSRRDPDGSRGCQRLDLVTTSGP
jgi:hypothetical protein